MEYFSNNDNRNIDSLKGDLSNLNLDPQMISSVDSLSKTQKSKIILKAVKANAPLEEGGAQGLLVITEDLTGIRHEFRCVNDEKDVDSRSFMSYTGTLRGDLETLENLHNCILQDPFFAKNYNSTIRNYDRTYNEKLGMTQTNLEIVAKINSNEYDCSVSYTIKSNPKFTIGGTVEKSYRTAMVDAPKEMTFVNNPNYVIFNNNHQKETKRPALIDIAIGCYSLENNEYFNVTFVEELTKEEHLFKGVLDKKDLDNESFLVDMNSEHSIIQTTYNLKECLMRNPYIRNNFNIMVITPDEYESISDFRFYYIGGIIRLVSKGSGIKYDCKVTATRYPCSEDPSINYHSTRVEISQKSSTGRDSIDFGSGDYQIELDVYTDTGIEWGASKDNISTSGKFLTTLSKSYFGRPLWFELNTLMSKKSTYSSEFLTAFDNKKTLWVDPGTMNNYRFVARRTGNHNTEPIYNSEVLYTINGYDYTLRDSHLGHGDTDADNYILDLLQNFELKDYKKALPLTTSRERTHIKGQKQYLNCLLKNKFVEGKGIDIALLYKIYTQSGKLIDQKIDLRMHSDKMQVMNTTELKLDDFLPLYKDKKVGRIDVCLITFVEKDPTKTYVEISENMSFSILPSVLHSVHDFAFLNRLGGWDSVNFGGSLSNEFKVTSSSIFKTLQPGFKSYTDIESMSSKSIEEKFILLTSPITYDRVEWLRELIVSPAVYELSSLRYVLVDDLTLKYSTEEDLYQIELKYHYSDSFNGQMR